jgi:hypothetical protein
MSAQAQLNAARRSIVSADEPTQPGVYGSGQGSDPHITLTAAARAPGRATTGFLAMVVGTSITTLTVWLRDPHTLLWGELASFDVPNDALDVFKWITICGVNASEIYFETDAADETSGGIGPAILVIEQAGG